MSRSVARAASKLVGRASKLRHAGARVGLARGQMIAIGPERARSGHGRKPPPTPRYWLAPVLVRARPEHTAPVSSGVQVSARCCCLPRRSHSEHLRERQRRWLVTKSVGETAGARSSLVIKLPPAPANGRNNLGHPEAGEERHQCLSGCRAREIPGPQARSSRLPGRFGRRESD